MYGLRIYLILVATIWFMVGTGQAKTTISRLFRALETQTIPDNCEVEFSINGKRIRGPEFPQAALPVRVFNRDFVSANVFQAGGRDVPPILVLGEDSVEKQTQVEKLKADLAGAKAERDNRRSQRAADERSLDTHCINQARVARETLRSTGQNPYNNFDKSHYQRRVQEMSGAGDQKPHILDHDAQVSLNFQIHQNPKAKIPEIDYTFPLLSKFADEVGKLLQATVVSAAIKSLQSDQELSSWVYRGIGLHDSYGTHQCLFCGQTLPENCLDNLSAHFNAEYERLLKDVGEQTQKIEQALKDSDAVVLPHDSQFYDDLVEGYKNALREFKRTQETAKGALSSFVRVLTEKKGRLFESSTLDVRPPQLSVGIVEKVNRVVLTHNSRCEEFHAQVVIGRDRLAANIVAESLDTYESLAEEISKSRLADVAASTEVQRLEGEIVRVEREIVEHRRPAAELNEDLRRYLGHGELQLTVKETGYEITRNGESAQSLSEGEITAIALLYFLKSLDDRRFDAANGVVVLDDPVSSLDANALFLAFGFIRERTQDAGQLFILTHNFTFFRNVKNWLHNMAGQRRRDVNNRPARLYMLEWQFGTTTSQRLSTLRPLDPLLEWYESEYHYLFARILRESQKATSELF